jgi:hypothetical protein
MGRFIFIEDDPRPPQPFVSQRRRRRRYGPLRFLWDCFLVVITGGLWLIWIFVREMRGR